MAIQSMDAVLADAEAPVHDDAETEVLATEAPKEVEEQDGEGNQDDQGHDAHGALHAERQRVKRKYTETVADFEKRLTEANSGFEKKLTDTLAENDRRWEQRFNQFAQQIQPRQEQKTEPEVVPDIFENPNGFVDHSLKKALDPVEQRIAKITEGFSRRMAIKEHGEEKVHAAFSALDQAAKSGNREAIEFVAKVKQSDDPFGEIVAWHGKSSVISEVGNDPAAFVQKKLEEALNDPAFLAKAAEKLGVKVPGKQPNQQQTLPSVNRVTAAADDDGDEEDAKEVFNSALRSGARRGSA